MKLHITNLIKVLFAFCFIFFNTAGLAQACAPDVVGRVITTTGAPVVGVWVKWTDFNGNTWYAKTDRNGNYSFNTWTYLTDVERNTFRNTNIDTNLDGNNDSRQANIVTPDLYDQFECGGGKIGHSYSVVKPVNMNGSFTQITKIIYNCGVGTYVLPDIIFTSNGPPPTPSPTPTGLTTKTANFGIVPTSGIHGNIFIDSNMNGIQDTGENIYTSGTKITIIGTQYAQTTTDSFGNYAFPGIPDGKYTVFATLPPNYHSTSPTNVAVTLPPPGVANFGMVSAFTVKGNVYNDINKNLKLDAGEQNIANAKIVSSGGFVVMDNGYYEVQDLIAGTYTINYTTPLQNGFYYLHPKPPTYQVRVGAGCSVDSTTGASCVNDSIENLNFAITDSMPWHQTYGMDARFDNGYQNLLPASTTCGGGSYSSGTVGTLTSPGIIFTGDSSTDFGQGSASKSDQIVGGISYPEVYSSAAPLKTSVQNLLSSAAKSGITTTPISTVAGCNKPATSCDLSGLPSGFYHANGNIKIDKSANFNAGNYVIVSDGNITFTNNASISVTSGSTMLFAAGKDIIIDPSVSAPANVCPVPAGQLQGIFSADRNITIEGNNGNCTSGADKMLNVDGVLIVNAGQSGGQFKNNRDLCADNHSAPTFTVKARPDFILNVPGFLTHQQTLSHEEAP